LTQAGARLYAGWVYHWLLDPGKVRPGAVMPQLFADDVIGRSEAYAVAAFLASTGKAPEPPAPVDPRGAKEHAGQVEQGKKFFVSLGCAACHGEAPKDKEPVAGLYSLAGGRAFRWGRWAARRTRRC